MKELVDLDEKRMRVLTVLSKTDDPKKIADRTKLTTQAVMKYLREFADSGLVDFKDKKYKQRKRFEDLRIDPSSFAVLDDKLSFTKPERYDLEEYEMDKKKLLKIPSLFGRVRVKDFEVIFKPVWRVTFESSAGLRVEKIDAI